MRTQGRKTSVEHWEGLWSHEIRERLPSSLNVSTKNAMRLLRTSVKPGIKFLEIGCSHWKLLAWVAKVLRAKVAGLDYSENGMKSARMLFEILKFDGDVSCKDLFSTTFEKDGFAVVHKHVDFVKRGA